ncbi:MAG TPA: alanine racemase, partial [Actinomycetota bacterium]
YMAVVKANGYGHGAVPIARAALEAGAEWLGVALVEEGVALREAGITARVLVLTEFPRGSEKEALAADLTPVLYTEEGIEGLAEAAETLGLRARVHVKVDTGMHRVGLLPDLAVGFLERAAGRGLGIEGILTHFAKSEAPDDPATRQQLATFGKLLTTLSERGSCPPICHAANTAASMVIPESRLDLIRVGIGTFGIAPDPSLAGFADLRPVMSLRSRVTLVKRVGRGHAVSYGFTYRLSRDATIVTVPVGYADGFARSLSNRARVLIRGQRYPVVGTVTMDQLLVDCGDDPVEAGDEVVLWGRQGDEEILAEDVAAWWGTTGYEVVCAVSERVPREYLHG